MKILRNVRGRIPELFGFPDQTLPGEPIIEVYGDRRALIEGKCSVIQYCTTCIKLRNSCGVVGVSGFGLCIAELSLHQTIITGRIESISICKG